MAVESNNPYILETSTTPFVSHCWKYRALGLVTIPCAEENGKRASAKWGKYQNILPSQKIMNFWRVNYAAANIGLITGQFSGFIVIDCDDPKVTLEELEAEFGVSKFVIRTPSGGFHLYYRWFNQKTILRWNKRKIDILGNNHIVIAPGSYNPGRQAFYEIIKGSLDDLKNLTECSYTYFKTIEKDLFQEEQKNLSDSLKQLNQNNNAEKELVIKNKTLKVLEGNRDNILFKHVLQLGRRVSNSNELLKETHSLNQTLCHLPLPDTQIKAIVKKVWEYKVEGHLFIKGERYACIRANEFFKLIGYEDAVVLLLFLRINHLGIRSIFAISQKAVSKTLKFGDNCRRIKNAIQTLIKEEMLSPPTKIINEDGKPLYLYSFPIH